jgi:hypothetical protein
MKLLTLSDGYGDSNAVPIWYPKYWKWPKIIELMTKGVVVNNCSRYGAGNEFIVNQLKQQIDCADVAIIQWARPDRLDLVLEHKDFAFWNDVIASDPVYNNNIVVSGLDRFWISSGSKTPAVQEYHQKYITKRQHQLRSQMFIEYAKLLLENRNIEYRFMLVENSSYINIDAKWICHEPFNGMDAFRYKSKYQDLELGIVQPIPLVAFDFIKQYIMPSIDLHWRTNREIDAVENMLYRHYREAIENKKQYDSY